MSSIAGIIQNVEEATEASRLHDAVQTLKKLENELDGLESIDSRILRTIRRQYRSIKVALIQRTKSLIESSFVIDKVGTGIRLSKRIQGFDNGRHYTVKLEEVLDTLELLDLPIEEFMQNFTKSLISHSPLRFDEILRFLYLQVIHGLSITETSTLSY